MQNHYQPNSQLKEFSLQYHVIYFGEWASGFSCLKIVKHDTVVDAPKLTLELCTLFMQVGQLHNGSCLFSGRQ